MKRKNLKAVLLALGVSLSSMVLTSCGESEYEYEPTVLFNSILDDIQDDTCLDEILKEEAEQEAGWTALQMFTLEKYLVLSEKLHTLNLEVKEENSNADLEKQDIDKSEPLDINDQISMINTCERDIETLEYLTPTDGQYQLIVRALKNAEVEINKWLYSDGYQTTMRMAYLVSKAKLVDAFSLNKDEYENFSILENPEDFHEFNSLVRVKYTDPNSKSEFNYDLQTSKFHDQYLGDYWENYLENKLAQLISVVDQSKKLDGDKKQVEKDFSYSEELNKNLTQFTGIIKSSMYAKFKVEDGKIIQYPENNEVNSTYKAKTKSLNKQ